MGMVVAEFGWFRAVIRPLRWLGPLAITALLLIFLVYVATSPSVGLRLALTLLLLVLLGGLAVVKPVYAVATCIAFGPWIGFIRRVLDSAFGTPGLDTILTVIPFGLTTAFVATCLSRRAALRELFQRSVTFRLVVGLIALLTLETVNPLQGGLAVGLGGAIFRLIPLFVVVIVAVAGESIGPWVLRAMLAIAFVDELYGLNQTFLGFSGFEKEFIDRSLRTGYNSISVGGVIRAFGTFVSNAEYVYYIDASFGVALAFGVSAWRQRRVGRALTCLGLCGLGLVAVILDSHRQSLLLMATAVLFVVVAQQARVRRAVVVALLIVGVAFLIQRNLPTVQGAGAVNQLLAHGLTTVSGDNVLADQSIQGHVLAVIEGLKSGFTNPLGRGLGAGSQAATKFGGEGGSTEYDLTDMVLMAGFAGFGLYVMLLIRLVAASVRLYRRRGRPEHLAAGAAIVASLGEILGPGYYVFGATLLALAGWLIREELRDARDSTCA